VTRSRVVSATNPALAIPSPAAPTAPLSRCRRLLRARPPSLPTVRLAMFTRDAGERFSGSDGRPTTSATTLPTHGHTLEHPFLANNSSVPHLRRPRTRPRSRGAFYGTIAFPCRRRSAKAASRDNPSRTDPPALQARNRARPRMLPFDRDAACGRRLDPTTACGDGRRTATLDCTGRVAPSEGPPLPPPAAAGRRGRRFPSSFEPLEHPFSVVESLNGGLDSPTVLMNRPRPSFRHRPAKGNAFPKAGVLSTARNPVG